MSRQLLSLLPLGLQAYRSIPEHRSAGIPACLPARHGIHPDHAQRVSA